MLNWFLFTEAANDDTSIVFCSCGIPPRHFYLMPEYLNNVHHLSQLKIMIGCSGFDGEVGCVEAVASNDISEIMCLGVYLMWNDDYVCGGRIRLTFFVSVWSEI